MRRFVSAGLALSAITLALGATSAVQAQTITNGSFEAPVVLGQPGNFQYAPVGASFSFVGSAGIVANNSAFGQQPAPNGTQAGFVQRTGSFSQIINFVSAGNYGVSFFAAQRSLAAPQTFAVQFDGVTISTFTPTSTAYASFSTGFTPLTAGNHTLTFIGTNAADVTAFVDNITITSPAAPEPGSLALLLPVVGAVGIAVRRRKK